MTWISATNEAAEGWDWTLFWTIVGASAGSLALIGVLVAVVAYRRQFPKRRMAFGYDSRSLLRPHALPRGDLEVRIQGTVLAEPHFVELDVWSESRADIPSTSFDAQQSITFNVRAENVVPGWSAGAIEIDIEPLADGQGVRVSVAPQLIRKHARATVTFVTDGEPSIKHKSPLIDIPLVKKYDSSDRYERPTLLGVYRRMFKSRWFYVGLVAYAIAAFYFIGAVLPLLTR